MRGWPLYPSNLQKSNSVYSKSISMYTHCCLVYKMEMVGDYIFKSKYLTQRIRGRQIWVFRLGGKELGWLLPLVDCGVARDRARNTCSIYKGIWLPALPTSLRSACSLGTIPLGKIWVHPDQPPPAKPCTVGPDQLWMPGSQVTRLKGVHVCMHASCGYLWVACT